MLGRLVNGEFAFFCRNVIAFVALKSLVAEVHLFHVVLQAEAPVELVLADGTLVLVGRQVFHLDVLLKIVSL